MTGTETQTGDNPTYNEESDVSPIRVGSKDVKIIINKSRLATRVYVGDILIEDYLDNK